MPKVKFEKVKKCSPNVTGYSLPKTIGFKLKKQPLNTNINAKLPKLAN